LDYLELQNATLTDDHKKLTDMGEILDGRIERTEANVGIWSEVIHSRFVKVLLGRIVQLAVPTMWLDL